MLNDQRIFTLQPQNKASNEYSDSQSTICVTFPDGGKRHVETGATGLKLAESISISLAKQAVVVRVDGQLWDLSRPLINGAAIEIIKRDHPDALEILRHDTAHVLAQAVKELFPEVQVTIGPSIENGFYYDFYRQTPFSLDDLTIIEQRMRDIVDRDLPIQREVWDRDKAIGFFKSMNEHFKAEIIRDLPDSEEITLYRQGEFVDLCRGPHFPSTGKIGKAFKLTKIAGAYWRGDSTQPMLQRIYGTVWRDQAELDQYLEQLEQAEKRDHRRLGREMQLFHFQDEAAGSVFWHPKGWTLYRLCEGYIRSMLRATGYQEIKTPQLLDKTFWEKSGHWDKYRENMFVVETGHDGSQSQHENLAQPKPLALKPMSCPCHVQVFKQGIKSYRDLPLRLAEFGTCHRNEASGALHGLMRVRAMNQDDGHIFCRPDQILSETQMFCDHLRRVYADFGFDQVKILFSDRPTVRAGSDDIWDKAESALWEAANAAGLEVIHNPGDGAFYGPKLDFILRDAIGREWQCGTLQVDFVLPERLEASYIGEDNQKHRPVMLHRAILGSLERFLGVVIEHYAGKFPFWLAPVQVVVTAITDVAADYAGMIQQKLIAADIRSELDLRNEKINYKIREHSLSKIPLMMIVGGREAEQGTVVLRWLGQDQQETIVVDDAIQKISEKAEIPYWKPAAVV